ncbi:MAG TPA: thiamine pyrophosphate-dependent enzyme [Candidatus Polarisedimenticolaceae bacterium]|nr:thiamine pyrophosphate-dependent enzyme [Candidatus Polarisedimenticolaceae bacterium]
MARLAAASISLESRFAAFAAERFPFALDLARDTLRRVLRGKDVSGAEGLRALRAPLASALRQAVEKTDARDLPETAPGTSAPERLRQAAEALAEEAEGFLAREAVLASLTAEEKRDLLRGMVLTRAVDNRLKALFLGGEVRFGGASFQGKGFRSLGQEAIYGAALRLRRGPGGDVVGPIIRDLGVVLAMRPEPATVRMVLSAQMGKAGPPMEGRDLHVGDWEHGILPASAPLTISAMTLAGAAMAFARDGSGRVAVTFIGEGGASLGEWHEAVNLCAARKLPAVFCLQNNQTALSTPVHEQSAVRTFADKAAGYGILGLTVDGTDPEAIAAAFAWAAERAREGKGPTLLELVAMRMCGHAHHDDMLYLGKEPAASWNYPTPVSPGYADPERHAFWAARDPIPGYAAKLRAQGLLAERDLEELKREAEALVDTEARAVIAAPWPDPATVGTGVLAGEAPRVHLEPLQGRDPARRPAIPPLPPVDSGPAFDPKGKTFLEAVMLGVGDALRADPRVFVYGEDVGGKYGNAFLLLRPLLQEFGERILNSTLSEAGTLGVCVGAALCGQRPIGEIQFNDFVATGFNQLVNNAAKIRYRWGGSVPMVVRMPWGGLRRAGPYHSQNTEPWFYRTPGLKIVVPSTPADARALMASAVADPDPVLYYEHIALYRDPRIKQVLPDAAPEPLPLGKAALRRAGEDLALISYGAYVHVALRVAETLAKEDGVQCAVLDLRSLAPLDREAVITVARLCGKVLICHEDSRTGGIGESLAAVIQEEAFEELDAPVRVVGALDTPVPYSPTLEDAFLPGEAGVLRAARLLAAY